MTDAVRVVHMDVRIRPARYRRIVELLVLAAVWVGLLTPEQAMRWYEGFFKRTTRVQIEPFGISMTLEGMLDDRAPAVRAGDD